VKDVPSLRDTRQQGTLLTSSDPIHYADAWALQQRLHAERLENRRSDTLLLLEHQAVYTMGRQTLSSHLLGGEAALQATGAAIEPVNRGGSVTYHGPGQLVGYPILRLSRVASGPKEYVWLLEETLRRTLSHWGIESHRLDGKPGLFAGPSQEKEKIASIGVRIDRGVTFHGFALNVDLDLTPFSYIVPCGLKGCRMTSIAALRQSSVPIKIVAQQIAEQFGCLFNLKWQNRDLNPFDSGVTGAYDYQARSDEAMKEETVDA